MNILSKLNQITKIERDKQLAPLTTFNIGGPAKYFCEVKSGEEIVKLVEICQQEKLPYFILGGGSNVLFSEKGFDGLIIRILDTKYQILDTTIECSAGLPLNKLVSESVKAGLVGLEWATGIPGSVGGAIYQNAGAYGGEISESLVEVTVLRDGQEVVLKNKDCQLGYRTSVFKKSENRDIVLSAKFKLVQGEPDKTKIKEIGQAREEKFGHLPLTKGESADRPEGVAGAVRSAGSFFRNILLESREIERLREKFPEMPEDFVKWGKIPAAWLIDQCGLKGKKIGGAQVSEKHAGIIINTGKATASDIIMLASAIKQKVRTKFSLQLMEEVEYIGF